MRIQETDRVLKDARLSRQAQARQEREKSGSLLRRIFRSLTRRKRVPEKRNPADRYA